MRFDEGNWNQNTAAVVHINTTLGVVGTCFGTGETFSFLIRTEHPSFEGADLYVEGTQDPDSDVLRLKALYVGCVKLDERTFPLDFDLDNLTEGVRSLIEQEYDLEKAQNALIDLLKGDGRENGA